MKVKIFNGTVAEMQKQMSSFMSIEVREVAHIAVGSDDKGKTVIVVTYIESETTKKTDEIIED